MPILRPTNDFDHDDDVSAPVGARHSPLHFEGLAKSAFDFFEKAFAEVQVEPKYSAMHFYNGIELLFKARLLHEHWSLVVAKPEGSSLAKFKRGDFQSVTLEGAIQRLENIAEERVSKEEKACFASLGNHRNRIVHFLHDGYAGDVPDSSIVSGVVAEQFRAWVYVHRRLEKEWSEHFLAHSKLIGSLNETIKKNRQFLSAKFELVRPEIHGHRVKGSEVVACDSCGFDSVLVEPWEPPVRNGGCIVCGRASRTIAMECPECDDTVFFEEGDGTCSKCDTNFDLSDLVERFAPDYDPREGQSSDSGYCPDCELTKYYTVVPWSDGYVCLNCTSTFDRISHCGWCSEQVAGELDESSYLTGCLMCEGRFGNDRD